MIDIIVLIVIFYMIHWVTHHGLKKKSEQEKAVKDAYSRGFQDGIWASNHEEVEVDE